MANMHITLRFIGDVDDVGVDKLAAGLDEIETSGPFSFRLGSLGAFPALHKATVAWIAIEESGQLSDLAADVDEAVFRAGFGHEDRPFHPHLTLARIRPPQDLTGCDLESRLGAKINVDRFTLYQSSFVGRGVEYEALDHFEL